MVVLITLIAAGADTGPTFDLYSDVDGFDIPFDTEIDKQTLLDGYECNLVPNDTTVIRIVSHNNETCTNHIDITISLTTTSTSSTTTTTSTAVPLYLILYSFDMDCEEGSCPKSSGTITVNGDVVYSWNNFTPIPDAGIFNAQIGDTIEIDGIAYTSGSGCVDISSTLTYYVNGIQVDTITDDALTYSFVYAGEGSVSIVKGCMLPPI